MNIFIQNNKQVKSLKNQIIKGTVILSLAGLLTRIIGFYYRIFLSRRIGASGMGLYQMIFPVFGLCYSFAVVGIQMSISRFTAIKLGKKQIPEMYTVLKLGIFFSLVLSLCAAVSLYTFSDSIAIYILDDIRCSKLLKIVSLAIPIGSVHSCISGYYLGKKNAGIPAWSQLLEQIVRVGSVYVISLVLLSSNQDISPSIAVWGLVLGEISSALFCICFLSCEKGFFSSRLIAIRATFRDMFAIAYPITLNKIIVSILSASEAILIPLSLKKSGMADETAISIYGILMGMSMPFILFPSTITNSISAMILPSVAEAQATGNNTLVSNTSSKVIEYCLSIGIFCSGFFYIYGDSLGIMFFNSPEAGLYISILSWLCPFLYLSATIGSILNGMGMTKTTFIHNMASSILRLSFIIIAVPRIGIKGCLFGILSSFILCSILHISTLYRHCPFYYSTYKYIIKPALVTVFALGAGLVMSLPLLSMAVSGCIFCTFILFSTKKQGMHR